MNRYQKIALALFAGNLLLILLFPPVDEYTIVSTAVPVFSGFRFVGDAGPRTVLNESFLTLEVLVLLANAGIAWLLLGDRPRSTRRNHLGLQNTVLLVTGVNLVAVLLFPPFESVFQMTRATIPTFEGFYFVFDQKPAHVIVTTLLYIEVFFIIANGALFWLLFRPRPPRTDAGATPRPQAETREREIAGGNVATRTSWPLIAASGASDFVPAHVAPETPSGRQECGGW